MIFGWLICWKKGHKRGKRVKALCSQERIVFQCPRCGAQWERKTTKATIGKM